MCAATLCVAGTQQHRMLGSILAALVRQPAADPFCVLHSWWCLQSRRVWKHLGD